MKIHRFMLIIIAFFLASSTGFSMSLEQIGDEYLEELWRFHPVSATYQGVHVYDTLLADYSKNALKTMKKRLGELDQELSAVDTTALSIDNIVDYYLLKASIADELFSLKVIREYAKNPLIYSSECIYGVYTILLNPSRSSHDRIYAIWRRLEQIPDYLERAVKNLDHPSRFFCEIASGQLRSGTEFIDDIYTIYVDSLPDHKKTKFKQITGRAVAAMKLFSLQLEMQADQKTPYVLGRDHYEYMLNNIHLLNIDADSLLKIGQNTLDSVSILIDSLHQIHPEPVGIKIMLPENFGKSDVESYRSNEILTVREFVEQSGLVTVPKYIGDINIVETPEFILGLIPGIAMQPPGPFDDFKTSYFYVPPVPDQFNIQQVEYYYNYVHNRQFRSGVVHEAYPGHHLQISIANQHPSTIRRSFHDYIFIEGWALYCEEFMARSMLYQDDTLGALINVLQGVKFRAARVIVDVMLQTGQMSYDEAVTYMSDVMNRDRRYVAREVGRYITDPGQASSYLLGKVQLLALLDDFRKAQGADFSLKEFHDNLLSHGSIPVALIKRLMLSEPQP
ncbi:MAG: DUF885 domain-containing protein [bacterium]